VHGDGNAAPKMAFFHFLVKSRPIGANPLTDFYNVRGLLYAQLSGISVSHLTRFTLQVTEYLLRNRASVIYLKFCVCTRRKNYALDRKMIGTFMVSMFSITMQYLGETELCAPAAGAKMWCLCRKAANCRYFITGQK